jgi:transmembrane sensor
MVNLNNTLEPSRDDLLDQAVDWMVCLQSGVVSAEEKLRFSAWLALSKNHQQAWQTITHSVAVPVNTLQSLPREQSPFIEQALLRKNPLGSNERRAFLRNSFAVAGLSFGLASLAGITHRYHPLSGLSADLSTGTAERLHKTLIDGSDLILNARSQVNISLSNPFNANAKRAINLQQGEMQLTASQQLAPFVIHCQHGQITVLSNKKTSHCLLKKGEQSTLVVALTGELTITNQQGQTTHLAAGEAVRFNGKTLYQKQQGYAHKAQWSQGLYLAKNESLYTLTQAFADYYPGFIRVSEQAKSIKVYGGYPLDDLNKSFATLAQTLPIKMRKLGALVTFIDVA